MNHVHKDTKYLLSVKITLENDISGGETMLYDRVKTSEMGSRAHVLKHLCGRIIFDQFEKCYREGTLWRGPRAVLSFIIKKTNICTFLSSWGSGFITYISIKQSKQSILMTMVLG